MIPREKQTHMSEDIRDGRLPSGERIDRLAEEVRRLDAALRLTVALLIASVVAMPLIVAAAISPAFRTPLFASLPNLAALWAATLLLVAIVVRYVLSVLR